jgi:glycosyltransferase involved in cell wall biosynthesis
MISIITTSSPLPGELEAFMATLEAYRQQGRRDVELLVVDDLRILDAVPPGFPPERVKILRPAVRGQLDAGIAALAEAKGELVITMDPDMCENVADIDRFVAEHAAGSLLIYGRRISRSDVSSLRQGLSRFYNALLQQLFDLPVHDINTPMLMVSRRIITDILAYDGHGGLVKLYFPYRLGRDFSELDIRVSGVAKTSSYSYASLLLFMLKQLAAVWRFQRFRQQERRHAV